MSERVRRRLFLARVAVAAVATVAAVAGVLFHLFTLQVSEHDHYRTLSEENRLKLLPSPPARGSIYDRNGLLLAGNHTAYSIEITPSAVADVEATLREVRAVVDVGDGDVRRFRKMLAAGASPRHGVPLRSHLSDEEVARLAVVRHRLDGVDLVGHLARHYLYDGLFAHAIGYVGAISRDDLGAFETHKYRGAPYIGKTGVERRYERALYGVVGFRRVEINAGGHVIRDVGGRKPRPGDDLMLTLDAALQEQAHAALDGHSGAVVVLDPRNGDVLALVSRPSYDPNLFSTGFSDEEYDWLRDGADKPFFNRAVSGQYPPGSTIKPVVALAALHNGVADVKRRMFAGPYYQLPGYSRRYYDWREEGHGWVDMSKAITQSCDVFFYDTAQRLGIVKLAAFLERFGFGAPTGIDATAEAPGLVPSPAWKREALGQPWFPAETIIAGIGQGYMLATPLQMAAMTAVLAMRGEQAVPRLVKAMRGASEQAWRPLPLAARKRVVDGAAEHWDYIVGAMVAVVHSPNGTAYRISDGMSYFAAGKTGTAQLKTIVRDETGGIEEQQDYPEDHAMFVAFAPVEEPEIAVAVVIEHGGSGGRAAAPVARRIFDAYFDLSRVRPSLDAAR